MRTDRSCSTRYRNITGFSVYHTGSRYGRKMIFPVINKFGITPVKADGFGPDGSFYRVGRRISVSVHTHDIIFH